MRGNHSGMSVPKSLVYPTVENSDRTKSDNRTNDIES
jgi:hypothetical protein